MRELQSAVPRRAACNPGEGAALVPDASLERHCVSCKGRPVRLLTRQYCSTRITCSQQKICIHSH